MQVFISIDRVQYAIKIQQSEIEWKFLSLLVI